MSDIMKKRPAGVPAEAGWNSAENEWQLGPMSPAGKKKPAHPIGEWRYWREDGTLCCINSIDDEGRLHGLHERYHEDGTLAYRGNWRQGYKDGHFLHVRSNNPSSEDFPGDEPTWRVEYDVRDRWHEFNERWYLEDGTECTSKGIPLDVAYDLDSIVADLTPTNYLDTDAPKVSAALGNERQPVEDLLGLREMWGVTSPELDKLLAYACDTDSFRVADSARTFAPDHNIWRDLIAHPHENVHEELSAVLSGAVRVGRFGDSDGVYATLFQGLRAKPTPNAVYLWSHDTYHVDDVISLTLDEFAYRTAISAACEAERLSPAAARAVWSKLAGRAHINWAACSGLDLLLDEDESANEDSDQDEPCSRSDFEQNLDPEDVVLTYFWRVQWILWLLVPDSNRDFDIVRECFRPGWNPTLDDTDHKDWLETGNTFPPLAAYLLWRYFWFDQQERLTDACKLYRNHPARVVRDLIALLKQIAEGQTKFGEIEDILAVRREFLKLDLCPENQEQRTAQAEIQALAKEQELDALRRKISDSAMSGLDAVLDAAWSHVRDPDAMIEIEKTLRSFPGHEMQWRALDWVRQRGYERANRVYKSEATAVGAWLARHGSDVVQPSIWSRIYADDFQPAYLLLKPVARHKGVLDTRFEAVLLAELDQVDKYNHKRALAVRLLAAMDAKAAVPPLCKVIDEFLQTVSGVQRSDLSLATTTWRDFLVEIAKALRVLCGEKSDQRVAVCNGLRQLVPVCFESSDERIAAEIVHTLCVCGEIDVMPGVRRLMASSDGNVTCVALRAVEALAPRLSKQERTEILEDGFVNHHKDENATTLLYDRALAALSAKDAKAAVDLSGALEEARELSNYGVEGWRLWRVVECETVSRCSPSELESISPYLFSTDSEVRGAAEAAFRAHNVEPPPRNVLCWVDIWKIEDSTASVEEAAGQIAALVADPQSVDRAPACAWLWEHPQACAAPALVRTLSSELDKFKRPELGEYLPSELEWLIRAAVKHAEYPGVKEVLERCLSVDEDSLSQVLKSENYGRSRKTSRPN